MASAGEVNPRKTRLMLVLNITPDSFSDGGRWHDETGSIQVERILKQIDQAIKDGFDIQSDILDIGGESTRPGAGSVPQEIETARVLPVIKAIRTAYPNGIISIDTRKATVAKAATDAGATIVNDVSGLQYDSAMGQTIAESGQKLVLMHSIGTPETMQAMAHDPACYPDSILPSVVSFFKRQIAIASEFGIQKENILLDPGFGFGKTTGHNLTLLKTLREIKALFPEHSVLVGTSRKSFLSLGQNKLPLQTRDMLTAASIFEALAHGGADIIRIHNIGDLVPVVRLAEAFRDTSTSTPANIHIGNIVPQAGFT